MSKVNNQTLKELKDAIELINENITEMRKTIKENHKEVMTKIEQVERKTEIALELAKIVNWRLAKEIKTEIIKLHAQKRTKVTVNQMYSKQLTARRNDALKRRYEMMKNDKTIQVKLDFPAVLKSKKRGTRGSWITVEQF